MKKITLSGIEYGVASPIPNLFQYTVSEEEAPLLWLSSHSGTGLPGKDSTVTAVVSGVTQPEENCFLIEP